jgi:hypothetical protein
MLATAHFTVLIEMVTHTFPHSPVRAFVCHKFGVCGFARMRAFILSTCASMRRAILTISVIPALSQRRINSRRSMSERTIALAIVKSCEPPPCTLRRAPLAIVACRAASRVPSYEPQASAASCLKPHAARYSARLAANRTEHLTRGAARRHESPNTYATTPWRFAAAPNSSRTHNKQRTLRIDFMRLDEVRI